MEARRSQAAGLITVLLAIALLGGCASEAASSASTSLDPPCDLFCAAKIDTPSGTIAVGTGWDEGAPLSEGYLAAWRVHEGTTTRAILTRDDGLGVPYLVRWREGAAVITTGLGAGAALRVWITSDGSSWSDAGTAVLPGEDPIPRLMTSWRSRMVILGEQLIGVDHYIASVWTSTDGIAWKLESTPTDFDDAGVSRYWEGGDGLVLGVYRGVPGNLTEQLWTSADLVSWRSFSPATPCELTTHGMTLASLPVASDGQ